MSSWSKTIGQKAKLRVRNKPGVLKVIKENVIGVTIDRYKAVKAHFICLLIFFYSKRKAVVWEAIQQVLTDKGSIYHQFLHKKHRDGRKALRVVCSDLDNDAVFRCFATDLVPNFGTCFKSHWNVQHEQKYMREWFSSYVHHRSLNKVVIFSPGEYWCLCMPNFFFTICDWTCFWKFDLPIWEDK